MLNPLLARRQVTPGGGAMRGGGGAARRRISASRLARALVRRGLSVMAAGYASRSPNLDGPPGGGLPPPAIRERAAGVMPNSSAARSIVLAALDAIQINGLAAASPARVLINRPCVRSSRNAIAAIASVAVRHRE
jgi:hypothetical protein